PVRCPLSKADGDRARAAATVEDPARWIDVMTEEGTRALGGAKAQVFERAFLVPNGVGALSRHVVPSVRRAASPPAFTMTSCWLHGNSDESSVGDGFAPLQLVRECPQRLDGVIRWVRSRTRRCPEAPRRSSRWVHRS